MLVNLMSAVEELLEKFLRNRIDQGFVQGKEVFFEKLTESRSSRHCLHGF